jgi:hypothetical protein
MLTREEQQRALEAQDLETESLLGGDSPTHVRYDPYNTQATVKNRLKKGERVIVSDQDTRYAIRYRPWRERIADYIAQNPVKVLVGGVIGALFVGAAIFFLAPVVVPTVFAIATVVATVTFGGIVAAAVTGFLHLCVSKVARSLFFDVGKRVPVAAPTPDSKNLKVTSHPADAFQIEALIQADPSQVADYELTEDRKQLLNFARLLSPVALSLNRMNNAVLVGHIKWLLDSKPNGEIITERSVTSLVKLLVDAETFDNFLNVDLVIAVCGSVNPPYNILTHNGGKIDLIKKALPEARSGRLSGILLVKTSSSEISINNIVLAYFQSLRDVDITQANLILNLARAVLEPDLLRDLDKKLIQIRSSFKLLIAKSTGKDVTTLEAMLDNELVNVFTTGVLAKKTGAYLANECNILDATISPSFFDPDFIKVFLPKKKLDGHVFDPRLFVEKSQAIAGLNYHGEMLERAMRIFLKLAKVSNYLVEQSGNQLKNSFFAKVEQMSLNEVCKQFANLSFCNFCALDTIELKQMLMMHYKLCGNGEHNQFKTMLQQTTNENSTAHELIRELKNVLLGTHKYLEKDLTNCTPEKVFDLFYQILATLKTEELRQVYAELTSFNQGGKKYSRQIADFMLLYLEQKDPELSRTLKTPLVGVGSPLNAGATNPPAAAAAASGATQLPVVVPAIQF